MCPPITPEESNILILIRSLMEQQSLTAENVQDLRSLCDGPRCIPWLYEAYATAGLAAIDLEPMTPPIGGRLHIELERNILERIKSLIHQEWLTPEETRELVNLCEGPGCIPWLYEAYTETEPMADEVDGTDPIRDEEPQPKNDHLGI